MQAKYSSKKILFTCLWLLGSSVVIFGGMEILARGYVHFIVQEGRLYGTDKKMGYFLRKKLALSRKRSDGKIIQYFTDSQGFRKINQEDAEVSFFREGRQKKLLIIGDSFAEGSVNMPDHLDSLLETSNASFSVRIVGCGGFGTDQEILLGRKLANLLGPGDLCILLTCGNDFLDVLRKFQFGRAKPWYSFENNSLIHHPPSLGLIEELREVSFLLGFIISRIHFTKYDFSDQEIQQAKKIYIALVMEFSQFLKERGITLVVVHHADYLINQAEPVWEKLRESNILTFGLDPFLGKPGPGNPLFLPCDHWTEKGYKVVGDAIASEVLKNISETVH